MAITYYTTAEKIKPLANLAVTENGKLEAHFLAAQDDVISIIGRANYDKYLAETIEPEEGKEDPELIKEKITMAESYFVLSYALPSLNTISAGTGLQKASGFGDNRQENMSEQDVRTRCEQYRSNAIKLLGKYKPVVDNDDDGNPDVLITPGLKFAVLSISKNC